MMLTPIKFVLLLSLGVSPLLLPDRAGLPPIVDLTWGRDSTLDLSASPAEVSRYFARLSPTQQAMLAAAHPQAVGNLDGAPLALRYAANAAASRRSHEATAERLRDAADAVGGPTREAAGEQVRGAAGGGRWEGRQILAYDPRGDGRVVEVLGDLAAARRVVILVPGNDNTSANFDRGLGGVVRRAPAEQARQVFARALQIEPEGPVAVIAWLGYDPPEGIGRAALREDRAEAGAVALRRFVEGLVVDCPQATFVVVGHSYGSVVVGQAASGLSARVTDLVALASPGMGVSGVRELGTRANVWAATAAADWIRRVPGVRVIGFGHGADPTGRGFGARVLNADGVSGHDGYFVPGSSIVDAVARIGLARSVPWDIA